MYTHVHQTRKPESMLSVFFNLSILSFESVSLPGPAAHLLPKQFWRAPSL